MNSATSSGRDRESLAEGAGRPGAPADMAVLACAEAAGMRDGLTEREAESRFDPTRGFHATLANGRPGLKGAVEVLAKSCSYARVGGWDQPLEKMGREQLLERAAALAGLGLRILLVAEGSARGRWRIPRL